jgi:hypothetical protein
MKKLLTLGAILLSVSLMADYLEVKTGEGKMGVVISSKPKLYVCYDKRVKLVTKDAIYLRYDGCARYTYSCKSNGKARFGKYPSVSSAKKALYRCRTSQPKFVD